MQYTNKYDVTLLNAELVHLYSLTDVFSLLSFLLYVYFVIEIKAHITYVDIRLQ